jgi:hypothetical protein
MHINTLLFAEDQILVVCTEQYLQRAIYIKATHPPDAVATGTCITLIILHKRLWNLTTYMDTFQETSQRRF